MNIAMIGTGLMGRPMGERIMNANHRLIAYNRTLEKAKPLALFGADVTSSPSEAIALSECVILMLADAPAIRETLLQKDSLGSLGDRVVIQMGTISPEESIAIQGEVLRAGGDYFEAPVLGSIPEAEKGELIVMVGSTPEQFGRWSDLLRCFGPDPLRIGPVGDAAALKLALNQLIASLTAAFALSLRLVERRGIGVDLFMGILRKSALYAPMFDKKLQRMIERDYGNPNFPTKHLAKDIDLFLNEAKSLSLEVSGLEGVKRLVQMTLTKGWVETDYSAMFSTVGREEK